MAFPSRASLALFWGTLLSLGSNGITSVVAFAPGSGHDVSGITPRARARVGASRNWPCSSRARRPIPALFESNDDEESVSETNESPSIPPPSSETTSDNSLLQRFLSPRIDDPGLPLTDVLLAQIVAPTFQIYWLALNRAPNPSWLLPISSYFGEAPELAPRGSLLAPTLIHGAGLAVCWLAGALAARSFERKAFILKGIDYEKGSGDDEASKDLSLLDRYGTILFRLFSAGAFASGILILSTQLDLLLEFKRYVQYGESEETDLRLLVATVEVINDIFWEALVIGSWRIIHANFMSTPTNRLKRF